MSGLLKNIAAKIAAFIRIVARAFAVFFDIESKDNIANSFAKIFKKIFTGSAYSATDYGLAAFTVLLVSSLKYYKRSIWTIFFILWGVNIAISLIIVMFSDKTKSDFTLMEGLRNSANLLYGESKIAGISFEVLAAAKFILWDGPDRMLIFFRGRVSGRTGRIVIFVLSSGVQMLIWAKLYSLGYDSVIEFVKSL